MDQDAMLTFELKNQRPVDLLDLTVSMTAFAKAFQDYVVAASGEPIGNYGLAVRELRTGSIIADLIPTADQITWLLDHKDLVGGFVVSLNEIVQYFITGAIPAAGVPTKSQAEQVSKIVEPVAKDVGSQLTVVASDQARVIVHQTSYISYVDANAVQNGARRLAGPDLPAERTERDVLLVLEQVKNSPTSKTGDRGIIEKISHRPIKLRFLAPDAKRAILELQDNPLRCAFLVDVHVKSVGGQPRLYEILTVNDVIPGEDE